jgi:hypothetical protein
MKKLCIPFQMKVNVHLVGKKSTEKTISIVILGPVRNLESVHTMKNILWLVNAESTCGVNTLINYSDVKTVKAHS